MNVLFKEKIQGTGSERNGQWRERERERERERRTKKLKFSRVRVMYVEIA